MKYHGTAQQICIEISRLVHFQEALVRRTPTRQSARESFHKLILTNSLLTHAQYHVNNVLVYKAFGRTIFIIHSYYRIAYYSSFCSTSVSLELSRLSGNCRRVLSPSLHNTFLITLHRSHNIDATHHPFHCILPYPT